MANQITTTIRDCLNDDRAVHTDDVDLAHAALDEALAASDIAGQVYTWEQLDLATRAGYHHQAERLRARLLGDAR